jgi:hypothetical protein
LPLAALESPLTALECCLVEEEPKEVHVVVLGLSPTEFMEEGWVGETV